MNCPVCGNESKQISCSYRKCKDCGNIFAQGIQGKSERGQLSKLIISSREILRAAYEKYKGNILIGFSGGKDSGVLLDLAVRLFGSDVSVVFNDTGCEFPETYDHIEKVVDYYNLTDFNETKPRHSFFKVLWYSRKTRYPLQALASKRYCCWTLKKLPLMRYGNKRWGELEWIAVNGVKNSDSRRRKNYTSFMEIDNTKARYHLCQPLVEWTDSNVEEYIDRFKIPVNPIYQWYDSTGCAPCPCPNKHHDYYSKLAEHHPRWYYTVWRHRKQDKIYLHEWLTEEEVGDILEN